MSAWSAREPDRFDALLRAGAGDRAEGAGGAGDVFAYALDWTGWVAADGVDPRVLLAVLSEAMTEHGPSGLDW
ncbi:hypothetical protein [Streptomyces sp. SID3343]|uniref:hypothetical protein n=1 Tax=Streptomyces sp. SID3343 TaxID=2690260 RepID=UPI001368AB42|nr:hypothetical protein [Streptomyces sp. SID3343]